MIKRIRLENYLRELYEYKNFEDYCYNGMQIEGKERINKISLGVSLNNNLIDEVIKSGSEALIVHHGFFGKEMGFIGKNINKLSLESMLSKLSSFLKVDKSVKSNLKSPFNIYTEDGFTIVNNGPQVPNRIAIISGGASNYYERAINLGADTFFCGEIKEEIPSLSYETKTNFINLTHYNSEKPGLLKLKEKLSEELEVETFFVDIPNPI